MYKNSHSRFKPIYVACMAVLITGVVDVNAQATAGNPALHRTIESSLQSGVWRVNQHSLVQELIQRNAQILYAELQTRIAEQQLRHERGIFEAELFTTLRHDDSFLQASVEQRSSLNALNKPDYIERRTTAEIGVNAVIPTGTEIRISYREQRRSNNHIPGANAEPDELGSEMTSSINLTVTQPLLRGLGAKQAKSKIEQARLEQNVVLYQYQQQLMRSSFDILSAYWQLYRVQQIRKVRREALENAQKMYIDIAQRVQAGRIPETTLLESESNIYTRKAELESIEGTYQDSLNKIKTLLNLSAREFQNLEMVLTDLPDELPYALTIPFEEYYPLVLAHWPAYQIAANRLEVQNQALVAARDEKRPKLDLQIGYSTIGLDETHKEARGSAASNDYANWFTSLNMALPIQGNQRAKSREMIVQSRIQQSAMDMDAVKSGLINDLQARLSQLDKAYDEVVVYREAVHVLKQIYINERALFDAGIRRLSDVYDREDRLNQGQQRHIDAQVRYELAKLSLRLGEGSLLAEYGVNLSDMPGIAESLVKARPSASRAKPTLIPTVNTPTPAASATAVSPVAATQPSSDNYWIIRLATFNESSEAERMKRAVDGEANYQATIVPFERGGSKIYTVTVGPFSTAEEANRQKLRYDELNKVNSTVVRQRR
jgi:outer membrane protein TolC